MFAAATYSDPAMPMRPRVKICGITRPQDGLDAARAGTDAIGLMFYSPSPRSVSVAQAREIVRALPPFVTVVGVFVNATPSDIEQVLEAVPIDVLQFQGDESPADCERFRRPYIKAVAMRDGVDLIEQVQRFARARAMLIDAYHPAKRGGSGRTFDWSLLPPQLDLPIVLAGGLTPDNVADAVARVRPFAVDVSGGVERAKGIKDPAKISAFIQGVNQGVNSGAG